MDVEVNGSVNQLVTTLEEMSIFVIAVIASDLIGLVLSFSRILITEFG